MLRPRIQNRSQPSDRRKLETYRLRGPSVKTGLSLTVLIDTSFFLTMLKGHRNFQQEIKNSASGHVSVMTTDGVIMELQRLARRGTFGTSGLAKVALETFEKEGIHISNWSPEVPNVDTSIVAAALAGKGEVAVATTDRRLRGTLFKHGLRVIFPRGRHALIVSKA